MKHLRIDSGKGQYSIDGTVWTDLDKLGKDDLFKLIDLALADNFEMDSYVKEQIPNPAHEVIYRNLSTKLTELLGKRDRFRDESQQLFREALMKYQG
jgi:hypothetical protein